MTADTGRTAEGASSTPDRSVLRRVGFAALTLIVVLPSLAVMSDGLDAVRQMPLESLAWVLFIGAANLLTLPVNPSAKLQLSLGAPIIVSAAVVLEPAHVALLVLVGATHPNEYKRSTPISRVFFNRSQLALCALAASSLASVAGAGGRLEVLTDPILATLGYNVVNSVAIAAAWVVLGYGTVNEAARESTSPFQVDFGLVSLLSVFVVVAHQTLGVGAVLLVALPLALGHNSLRSFREAEARAHELAANVDELQQLNTDLRDVQAARERLSSAILHEGARERARIALDLHDVVLPYLAAAEIQADNVLSALTAEDPGAAQRLAVTTRDSVHDAIDSLRRTLEVIRGQSISPGELQAHIAQAVSSLRQQHSLDIDVVIPDELPELPVAVELLVLDAMRGLLANVIRHSGARRATVTIEVADGMLSLLVADDGRGFDGMPDGIHEDLEDRAGQGLTLLQQRVSLARGTVAIQSNAQNGVTVKVEIPL